ncbi:MAG: RICIN domain-containing protein, partial [Oscillospiraceae bacterium]|nr:RICIN domain-containing protein [Oscillospiraceae bacterium]
QPAGGEPADDAAEQPPTNPPEPTEPPTERQTEPPTEPPTDPAELPEPDKIARGEEFYEIIPGARYYLWSPNSGLYLTVDGDFKYAGLSQDEYTGKPEQMFVFETVRVDVNETRTSYIYKIRALGTKDGYLDVEDGEAFEDGVGVVVTSEPEGEGSHEWDLRPQARGNAFDAENITLPIFSVVSATSRTARVLDVSGVSKDPGGFVHLWGGGTAANQKWFFELVSDVEAGNIVPIGLNDDYGYEFFE